MDKPERCSVQGRATQRSDKTSRRLSHSGVAATNPVAARSFSTPVGIVPKQ